MWLFEFKQQEKQFRHFSLMCSYPLRVLIITRSHFSFELRFCPDQIQMNTMGTKS